MQDQHNQHQLNGYKFSFNRVNPYFDQIIPKNQSNHSKKQPKHQISQIHSSINKAQTKSVFKLASIKNKTETVPTNNIIKNTKKIFYTKFNQNQKNKMLIDLYLRKTKFNKIKLSARKTDHTQIKNKLNQVTQANLDISDIVYNFSSTKENFEENQENQISHQSIGNQLQLQSESKIKEINPKQLIKEWEKAKFQSPKNKMNKSNHIKLVRNFSENKFHAYLTSPKQNLKVKISTSGTAPIQKIQKSDNSIISLHQDKSINNSSEKKKSKKKLHLQINTERCDFSSHDSDFIKVENIKNNQETIRKNFGALKYKSPRVMLTTRNQKFIGRKQTSKIRLFTEQQQKKIIQEFYNTEKTQQSLQKH